MAALALVLALSGALVQAVRPVTAQELAPQVELDPPCANLGNDDVFGTMTVTLRGHSFTPGSALVVNHWAPEPDTPRPTATTDEYGRFEVAFDVAEPSQLAIYRVTVTGPDSDIVLASTQLVVPCPGTVAITPNCGDPQPPGGQLLIEVTGQGWFAHFTLNVTFESAGGALVGEQVTVANGGFSTTLSPPGPRRLGLPPGVYAVVVRPAAFDSGPVPDPVSVTTFTVPCFAPEVTATPDCGPAGAPRETYELDVAGTGFVPLQGGLQPPITTGPPFPVGYLEIVFDPGGIPQRFIHVAGVGEDGAWGPARITPFRRAAAPITIRVRQVLAPSFVLLEREIPFQIPCPPVTEPTAEILPDDCGPPAFEGDDPERRYSLTVAGQGFDPGAVEIYFDAIGDSGYPVEPFAAQAAEDGSFSAPINPLARPVGRYEVHLRQERADGTTTTRQLVFDVPCELRSPTLSLVCDPLEPVPPDPGEVAIDSSGWFEDAPIIVSVTSLATETVRSDAVGRYTRRLDAGVLQAGALEVVAVQRDVRGTVVAQARGILPLPCGTPPEPMLRVLPASAPPGFVVTVEGTFFPAGESVELIWDAGLRAGQPMPAMADETGTFRLQVLIFHRDFLGPRAVAASRPGDPADTYTDEPAELLVVPGRGSPPAFVPPEGVSFEPDTRIVIRR